MVYIIMDVICLCSGINLRLQVTWLSTTTNTIAHTKCSATTIALGVVATLEIFIGIIHPDTLIIIIILTIINISIHQLQVSIYWYIDREIELLIDWLTDWLIDWLIIIIISTIINISILHLQVRNIGKIGKKLKNSNSFYLLFCYWSYGLQIWGIGSTWVS